MPTLGTNPISVVAKATGDDYYALDMATTTVALGKVRCLCICLRENTFLKFVEIYKPFVIGILHSIAYGNGFFVGNRHARVLKEVCKRV